MSRATPNQDVPLTLAPPVNGSPPIYVLENEYERLSDFVCSSSAETEALALLWSELLRAEIIAPLHAPQDLVRLNTVVRYVDVIADEERTARLVFEPEDLKPFDVAVTTTLGAALIGLRSGATFWWTSDQHWHAIRVEAVDGREAPPLRRGKAAKRRAPSQSCDVDEALMQSFPASDAPPWTLRRQAAPD